MPSNAARHSGATSVSVRLGPDEVGLALEVADNGRGFDPAAAGGAGHLGLENMAGAGTVAESIEAARRHVPDIVVMDVRLPDGSGIEACREIRALRPETRVVMLTSYPDEEAVLSATWPAQAAISSSRFARAIWSPLWSRSVVASHSSIRQ